MNESGWKPGRPEAGGDAGAMTYTGNKALLLEEALLFEIGGNDTTGVDVPDAPAVASRLGGLERNRAIGLPGLFSGVDRPSLARIAASSSPSPRRSAMTLSANDCRALASSLPIARSTSSIDAAPRSACPLLSTS